MKYVFICTFCRCPNYMDTSVPVRCCICNTQPAAACVCINASYEKLAINNSLWEDGFLHTAPMPRGGPKNHRPSWAGSDRHQQPSEGSPQEHFTPITYRGTPGFRYGPQVNAHQALELHSNPPQKYSKPIANGGQATVYPAVTLDKRGTHVIHEFKEREVGFVERLIHFREVLEASHRVDWQHYLCLPVPTRMDRGDVHTTWKLKWGSMHRHKRPDYRDHASAAVSDVVQGPFASHLHL
jgi:hypothetical protein